MDYKKRYAEFVKEVTSRPVEAYEAGKLILEMVNEYSKYNIEMIQARKNMAVVARDIECREDENTGKPISSAKAKVLSDATDETADYELKKIHVMNLEQIIAGLKSYIKSMGNEYSMSGNSV